MTALGGESRFRDDDGSAHPATQAALAAFGAGTGSEHAALTALAGTRLLVPLVAAPSQGQPSQGQPSQGQPGGRQHTSEMSVPTLIGRDGRPAIPAFTCLDTLARWQPGARPVPTEPGRLWRAAVGDSCAVVVDIAGPVPVAVDGARLAALADGRPVPLPHQDPDVQAAVRGCAAGQPAIAWVGIAPGEEGTDLSIQITLVAGCGRQDGDQAARALAGSVMAELGGRLRRGIAIRATPVAAHSGS